eukprot:11029646-Karenia_brevis.AAC.1
MWFFGPRTDAAPTRAFLAWKLKLVSTPSCELCPLAPSSTILTVIDNMQACRLEEGLQTWGLPHHTGVR